MDDPDILIGEIGYQKVMNIHFAQGGTVILHPMDSCIKSYNKKRECTSGAQDFIPEVQNPLGSLGMSASLTHLVSRPLQMVCNELMQIIGEHDPFTKKNPEAYVYHLTMKAALCAGRKYTRSRRARA